ncbi:MAG: hypothetical protein M1382_01380 [Candidatus Marsarchaeota archaeon]|jgi:hypothetical protein|nr:hypothetical protein [Candidatus Marsarchaeota archaeon]
MTITKSPNEPKVIDKPHEKDVRVLDERDMLYSIFRRVIQKEQIEKKFDNTNNTLYLMSVLHSHMTEVKDGRITKDGLNEIIYGADKLAKQFKESKKLDPNESRRLAGLFTSIKINTLEMLADLTKDFSSNHEDNIEFSNQCLMKARDLIENGESGIDIFFDDKRIEERIKEKIKKNYYISK